jgi:hypothetical protein
MASSTSSFSTIGLFWSDSLTAAPNAHAWILAPCLQNVNAGAELLGRLMATIFIVLRKSLRDAIVLLEPSKQKFAVRNAAHPT